MRAERRLNAGGVVYWLSSLCAVCGQDWQGGDADTLASDRLLPSGVRSHATPSILAASLCSQRSDLVIAVQ